MPRTIVSITLLAIFLMTFGGPQPVFAEEVRPCEEDIAKFCKDIKPGGGRIISCLKNHEGELSSVCGNKLGELEKKIEDAKQACTTDIEKYCKGVEPGEGRIAACLEKRSSELSAACAEKLDLLKTSVRGK